MAVYRLTTAKPSKRKKIETEPVTIAVKKDVHERCAQAALKREKPFYEFESDLLEAAITRLEFAETEFPSLHFHSVDVANRTMDLIETTGKSKHFITLELVKSELVCRTDKGKFCIHVKFALWNPMTAKLIPPG